MILKYAQKRRIYTPQHITLINIAVEFTHFVFCI